MQNILILPIKNGIIEPCISGGESNPDRFSRTAFREYAEKPLKIPMGIPFVLFLVLPKSSSVKTAAHPKAKILAVGLSVFDATPLKHKNTLEERKI